MIIGGIPPYLLKTPDSPSGVDFSVFKGIEAAVTADRFAFFAEFFKNFYNTDATSWWKEGPTVFSGPMPTS